MKTLKITCDGLKEVYIMRSSIGRLCGEDHHFVDIEEGEKNGSYAYRVLIPERLCGAVLFTLREHGLPCEEE